LSSDKQTTPKPVTLPSVTPPLAAAAQPQRTEGVMRTLRTNTTLALPPKPARESSIDAVTFGAGIRADSNRWLANKRGGKSVQGINDDEISQGRPRNKDRERRSRGGARGLGFREE